MTLEERVEALEMKIARLSEACFGVNDGEIFINDATITANKAIADALRPGGVLHAAQKRAAYIKNSENEVLIQIDGVNSVRLSVF